MPIIHMDILEGRTQEQIKQMVEKVTKAVCETLNAPPEAVIITINHMKKDEFAVAGKLKYL